MYRILFALVTGLGLFGSGPAFAAGVPAGYTQVTVTATVVTYETRLVPYAKEVTRYDHCGKPYTVCVTAYKEIEIAVKKTVTYTKWVKACE